MQIDKQKLKDAILSRLNFQEEYRELGVEILDESEKTGNFLVKNPYNPNWDGECVVVGRGGL